MEKKEITFTTHRIWAHSFGRDDLIESKYRCNRWGIWDGDTLVWRSPRRGRPSRNMPELAYADSLTAVPLQEVAHGMGA